MNAVQNENSPKKLKLSRKRDPKEYYTYKGEAAVASLWLIFYLAIVAITISSPMLSRAIESLLDIRAETQWSVLD